VHSATVKTTQFNLVRGSTTAPNKNEGRTYGESRRRSEEHHGGDSDDRGTAIHANQATPRVCRMEDGVEGRDGVRNQRRRSRQSRASDRLYEPPEGGSDFGKRDSDSSKGKERERMHEKKSWKVHTIHVRSMVANT
jgi:hypothetical protein